jgi:hypothetical protein
VATPSGGLGQRGVNQSTHRYTVRWSTSTPRSVSSSSRSRYDSPKRSYQQTAKTITSGGNWKPVKADWGDGTKARAASAHADSLAAARSHRRRNSAGVDAVLGYFGQTMEMTGGNFRVEVHDGVANNEHGVGLNSLHAERAGRTLQDNNTLVFHVRDGKVTEVW